MYRGGGEIAGGGARSKAQPRRTTPVTSKAGGKGKGKKAAAKTVSPAGAPITSFFAKPG